MAEVKKNLHVPLPADLHSDLKTQARRLRTPATMLAREAIEQWVERSKKQQLADEIHAYAKATAGSAADLDEDFEAASIETWLDGDP